MCPPRQRPLLRGLRCCLLLGKEYFSDRDENFGLLQWRKICCLEQHACVPAGHRVAAGEGHAPHPGCPAPVAFAVTALLPRHCCRGIAAAAELLPRHCCCRGAKR